MICGGMKAHNTHIMAVINLCLPQFLVSYCSYRKLFMLFLNIFSLFQKLISLFSNSELLRVFPSGGNWGLPHHDFVVLHQILAPPPQKFLENNSILLKISLPATSQVPRGNPAYWLQFLAVFFSFLWRSGCCDSNKGECDLNQSKDSSFVKRVAKNNN